MIYLFIISKSAYLSNQTLLLIKKWKRINYKITFGIFMINFLSKNIMRQMMESWSIKFFVKFAIRIKIKLLKLQGKNISKKWAVGEEEVIIISIAKIIKQKW